MACIVVLIITGFGLLDWCLCMSRKREPDFLRRIEDDLQEAWCQTVKG